MRKTCKNCSRELQKIDHESQARFEAKKFCSGKCGRTWLKENKQGWWSTKGIMNDTEVITGRQKYLAMRGGEL